MDGVRGVFVLDFLLCLWSDQVKCKTLSLVFNFWIGPGFSFEPYGSFLIFQYPLPTYYP